MPWADSTAEREAARRDDARGPGRYRVMRWDLPVPLRATGRVPLAGCHGIALPRWSLPEPASSSKARARRRRNGPSARPRYARACWRQLSASCVNIMRPDSGINDKPERNQHCCYTSQ